MPTTYSVDCGTGAVEAREMTPEEEAAHATAQAGAQATEAAFAARRQQRQADQAMAMALAATHPDPLVQALARLVGN